jgi:glycosyltransferase involved in cell wall biosynthesis
MVDPPLVSVVIPTYNRATLLRRTLESVAAQEYRPIETVVVDDASDDDTVAVLAQALPLLEERGVVVRSQVLAENAGPAGARNAGLHLATGSLVSFLASDDLWRPEFLTRLVDLLDRHPDCGVAFSGHVGIDIDDAVFATGTPELGDGADEGRLAAPFESFVRSFPFITSGTLLRRSVLDTVGWFDDDLASWEDADLWLRIAKRFDFVYTLAPLACYRLHEGNITNRRLDWYSYQLRVRLRHLADVHDPATRRYAVAEIQRAQVLLQEQLLRECRPVDEFRSLLDNEFAPTSLRFRVGRQVLRGPSRLRRTYAAAVRTTGAVVRKLQARSPAVSPPAPDAR